MKVNQNETIKKIIIIILTIMKQETDSEFSLD